MKKLGKSVICCILICIFIFSTSVVLADNKIDGLNSQIKNNQNKIDEVEKKKEEVQEIKEGAVKEVANLDAQIDDYQGQISNLESQISEINKKIEEENKKLEKAQKDYEEQQKTLEERVVALYEAGETNYLDVLLSSSDSLTDFISGYYIISEIAQCDSDLLKDIDKQKTDIENAKKDIENSKQELTNAKNSKQEISNQLQTKKDEKATYVAKLSDEEKKLQSQIDEIKKDNVSIDKQIKAYQAELERQIQEEIKRRKKEEEERKKHQASQNSSGSSSNGSSSSNSSGSSSSSSSSSGSTTSASSSGFISPLPSAYSRVTGTWYYSDGRVHGAVDYGSGGISGQPIYAVADGIVAHTAALSTSYGNYIIIRHYNGLYTLYAHGQAGSIAVSQGQKVKQGQQIMRVGSTGNSSGPHLHFEVRTSPGLYQNRVNPLNYLP